MASDRLKVELATYEQRKDELVAQNAGKFVLIHGTEVLGTCDTYEDAVKSGYEKCGLSKPFLVKQICAVERVQFITQGSSACPS
ncbi:MAG: hypothetical protein EXS05_02085 [Planctomycetaceae bacterium]|nr:hypothetical protein [Planctomycetaceae bacterium]